MDAVMLAALVAVVVDAAAGDDINVAVLPDEKVIVYQVRQAAFRNDNGNMDLFALGKGLDADVDAGLILLGGNFNELAVLAGLQLAIFPDIERAGGRALHIGDLVEQIGVNGVHAPASSCT